MQAWLLDATPPNMGGSSIGVLFAIQSIGSATGPIFTAGLIYGQVLQAEAQQQAALINYQKIIQNAFAEVKMPSIPIRC